MINWSSSEFAIVPCVTRTTGRLASRSDHHKGGGDLAAHADILVRAPSAVTARIQEVHTLCIHAIADSLDALIRGQAAT